MCDRTGEFFECIQRAGGSSSSVSGRSRPPVPTTKTGFLDAAADIGKGFHRTSLTLAKLTKLVRRQGLFDDPTEEINNLIFRIKQDLDELNTKCDSAQQYVDSKKRSFGNPSQSTAHNDKVVGQLKTGLMNATKDFKNVLEMRTSKMKESQHRKVALTGNALISPMKQFSAYQNNNSNSGKSAGAASASAVGGGGGGGIASNARFNATALPSPYAMSESPYGAGPSADSAPGNFMQQQQPLLLAPPQPAQYYEAREKSVNEVEKTIGELGTLFKRLSTMIMEQQELVERIDEDVEEAVSNADKAHTALIKAYEKVSSNRALYMKVGAILAIFILFFIVFLM